MPRFHQPHLPGVSPHSQGPQLLAFSTAYLEGDRAESESSYGQEGPCANQGREYRGRSWLPDRRMPRLGASSGSGARAVRERTGPRGHEIQALSLRFTVDPKAMPAEVRYRTLGRRHLGSKETSVSEAGD